MKPERSPGTTAMIESSDASGYVRSRVEPPIYFSLFAVCVDAVENEMPQMAEAKPLRPAKNGSSKQPRRLGTTTTT